jgi:hypothetical protein
MFLLLSSTDAQKTLKSLAQPVIDFWNKKSSFCSIKLDWANYCASIILHLKTSLTSKN